MKTTNFSKRWNGILLICFLLVISLVFYHPLQNYLSVNQEPRSTRPTVIKREALKVSTSAITTTQAKQLTTPNIYQYVEENQAGDGSLYNEVRRLKHFLATQGAICEDIRRIGGAKPEPWQAPRPYGADGAWDVCFDPDMGLEKGTCIVYSFGIGRDFSFDDGMAYYGCQVHSFDPTTGKGDHQHAPRVWFYNMGLSDHNQDGTSTLETNSDKKEWKTRTLASIIDELQHSKGFIDVVKMDIESDEWNCLPQMLEDGTLRRFVRQLNVEFHLNVYNPAQVRRQFSIIQWMNRQGIKVSSLHQNPYCNTCLEMTFINTRLREESNKNINLVTS